MANELFVNDPGTSLAAGCTAGATEIEVLNSSGYPASGNFRVKIDHELMLVTAVSGTTWTVTRGVESTTAMAHLSGAAVNHTLTAGAFRQSFADRQCYVVYRAAVTQNGTASVGFSFGSDGPTATVVSTATGIAGAASFPPALVRQVYDHFQLPTDWTSPIHAQVTWRTSATTGNVKWQVKLDGLGDGDAFDPTYNTASVATVNANGTSNRITITTISNIDTTGISADDILYFNFARLGDTDTCATAAELLELRFIMSRAIF